MQVVLILHLSEADNADSKTPSTAGVSASRYIFALYQQRLNEEALKLKRQISDKNTLSKVRKVNGNPFI